MTRDSAKTKQQLVRELQETRLQLSALQSREQEHPAARDSQRQLERRAKETAANLIALFENTPDAVWSVDKTLRLITFNTAFSKLVFAGTGKTPQTGMEIGMLVPPETSTRVRDIYRHVLAGRRTLHEQDTLIRGKRRFLELSFAPIITDGAVNGAVVTCRDISAHKQAEEQLRESEEKYRTLTENINIGVFRSSVAGAGSLLHGNTALARIFGYASIGEILNSPITEAYRNPEERKEVLQELFAKGSLRNREVCCKKKDGATIWCSVSATLQRDSAGTPLWIDGIVEDITERKQNEQARQEAERRLRQHMQETPVAVIEWDTDFCVTSWNPAAERIFGYTAAEAIGQQAHIIVPESIRAVVGKTWKQLLSQTGGYRSTNENITKEGRRIQCEWYNTALRSKDGQVIGAASIAQDVTERLQAEAALRESEERYRTVADFTHDWEHWINPDGAYLYVSPAFERITGYPREILLQNPDFLVTIVSPGDVSLVLDHIKSNRVAEAVPIEFRIKTITGEERWISHVCQKVYTKEGKYLGRRGSNRDITEEKRIRAEAIREAHLASIGELAAGVAHEINNPIMAIVNCTQLIVDEYQNRGANADIPQRVLKEGYRIGAIVRNLLSFVRGTEDEEMLPTNLQELFADSLALYAKQFQLNNIILHEQFEQQLPRAMVQPHKIQQVFVNLLSNAFYALNRKYPQAHPDKVLEVSVGAMAHEGKQYVRIVFHDHGIGIPENIMDKICNAFFSTKSPGEGTGLGLSISHSIVKNQGGRLLFESSEGRYTKVMVDLPASLPEAGKG